MSHIVAVCQWLEATSVGTHVRESNWLFPAFETIHLFGIVLLVGATSALDMRLLGVAMRDQPVTALAKKLIPWAIVGFAIQVLTGLLLFSSEATRCWGNLAFRIKMILIIVAGLNAVIFHFTAYRSVGKWDVSSTTPFGAKFAGIASIILWFGIVAAGRWIAFI